MPRKKPKLRLDENELEFRAVQTDPLPGRFAYGGTSITSTMAESSSPRRVTEPARRYLLGQEPHTELLTGTTAEERLEMVALLTRRAWELMGKPWPTLPRHEWPIKVVRRSCEAPGEDASAAD